MNKKGLLIREKGERRPEETIFPPKITSFEEAPITIMVTAVLSPTHRKVRMEYGDSRQKFSGQRELIIDFGLVLVFELKANAEFVAAGVDSLAFDERGESEDDSRAQFVLQ